MICNIVSPFTGIQPNFQMSNPSLAIIAHYDAIRQSDNI